MQEAAVVGVPHPNLWRRSFVGSQAPTKRARDRLTVRRRARFCDANIAHFQRPKLISFIDEIPKGATGKIQKNILRRMLQEKTRPAQQLRGT